MEIKEAMLMHSKAKLKREESKKYASLLQRTDTIPKRPMTSRHQ